MSIETRRYLVFCRRKHGSVVMASSCHIEGMLTPPQLIILLLPARGQALSYSSLPVRVSSGWALSLTSICIHLGLFR